MAKGALSSISKFGGWMGSKKSGGGGGGGGDLKPANQTSTSARQLGHAPNSAVGEGDRGKNSQKSSLQAFYRVNAVRS